MTLERTEEQAQHEKNIILQIKARHMPDSVALKLLEDNGFKMSASTLYKKKQDIGFNAEERAKHIIDNGILAEHISLIDDINATIGGLKQDIEEEERPSYRGRLRMQLIDAREALSIAMDDVKLIYEDLAFTKHQMKQWEKDIEKMTPAAATTTTTKNYDTDASSVTAVQQQHHHHQQQR